MAEDSYSIRPAAVLKPQAVSYNMLSEKNAQEPIANV
jgi:hypothetical protein